MPGHDDLDALAARIGVQIGDVMDDQNRHLLHRQRSVRGNGASPVARVVVATHGRDRRDLSKRIEHGRSQISPA